MRELAAKEFEALKLWREAAECWEKDGAWRRAAMAYQQRDKMKAAECAAQLAGLEGTQ